MHTPLVIRPLPADERALLTRGLRSAEAFTVRRGHILLARAEGQHTTTMAQPLRGHDQTGRHALHAFNQRGVAALRPQAARPHRTPTVCEAEGQERLRALLHQSPRTVGKPTSRWTLALAAEVSVAHGLPPRQVSGETMRQALNQLGVRWKRATHWITRPDPADVRKKQRRARLIRLIQPHPTWALGWADEGWWRRRAQPNQHGWAAPDAVPTRHALQRPHGDPDPKAIAGSGLLVRHPPRQRGPGRLRFGEGRPVSAVTTAFLAGCCDRLAAHGVPAFMGIWENAAWHIRQEVRAGLRTHHHPVKRTGQGVRIGPCRLPTKSPWLNPIEPKGVHGQRAVSDPDRLLSTAALEARVYAY